jgi:anti-anti-sigma regulatory factor
MGTEGMFRITTQNEADKSVLKLEGWLSGPWVKELDTCWRIATNTGRQLSVDLSEVYYVDDAGRQLLTLMYRAGVGFVTKGCVMPEMVREISESSDVVRRN